MMEFARFILVAAVGAGADLSIAYALVTLTGMAIWAAALVGFVIAACGNYFLHERWTFRNGLRTLSRKRALAFLGSSALILLLRLAAVMVLSMWIEPRHSLAILAGAAAFSLAANFAVSKFLIFSSSGNTFRGQTP